LFSPVFLKEFLHCHITRFSLTKKTSPFWSVTIDLSPSILFLCVCSSLFLTRHNVGLNAKTYSRIHIYEYTSMYVCNARPAEHSPKTPAVHTNCQYYYSSFHTLNTLLEITRGETFDKTIPKSPNTSSNHRRLYTFNLGKFLSHLLFFFYFEEAFTLKIFKVIFI